MNGMEEISEAILDKVKQEAQNIITEVEEKAYQEVEKSRKQREEKFEVERYQAIEEAKGEAARILAQASIAARHEVVRAKTDIIDEVIDRVKNALWGTSSEASLLSLIQEACLALGADDKVRVYVSPPEVSTTQGLLRANEELADRIVEVRELDCAGGVVVERLDGEMRIDNTYEARLEILLPRILPEISQELF